MKQGWEIKKLGEVCYFQNGFAFKSNTFTDRGEPILRISDIQNDEIIESKMVFFNPKSYPEDLSRFLVYPNDIVIAMSGGTTGKIGINKTNKTFYLNQRVGVFRENPNLLNHQYLYYFLKTKSEESLNLAAGAAQPNLSTVQINAFEIPTPSLAEQERIVEILDREFERIDALKVNAEQNLQHAKDLFQSALRQELQPKEGWVSKTVGEVCTLKSGNSNANNSSIGTLPFVKVGDMNIQGNEEEITCSTMYVSREENIRGIFPIGSVIFPKRGGAILTNKKRITATEICCDLNIMGVYSNGDVIPNLLYFYFLGVDLSEIYNGAAIPQINNGDIAPLNISFPKEIVEQQNIVDKLNSLKLSCKVLEENYTKTIALCDDMKQALLRKAFNGGL